VKDPSRFVFPVEPDIASVVETDIAIVLPQPLIAGQTKRLKYYPSSTRWPPFTPWEDSWYSFLLEAGRIRSSEKSNDFIGI
jgi:hypothetical protein